MEIFGGPGRGRESVVVVGPDALLRAELAPGDEARAREEMERGRPPAEALGGETIRYAEIGRVEAEAGVSTLWIERGLAGVTVHFIDVATRDRAVEALQKALASTHRPVRLERRLTGAESWKQFAVWCAIAAGAVWLAFDGAGGKGFGRLLLFIGAAFALRAAWRVVRSEKTGWTHLVRAEIPFTRVEGKPARGAAFAGPGHGEASIVALDVDAIVQAELSPGETAKAAEAIRGGARAVDVLGPKADRIPYDEIRVVRPNGPGALLIETVGDGKREIRFDGDASRDLALAALRSALEPRGFRSGVKRTHKSEELGKLGYRFCFILGGTWFVHYASRGEFGFGALDIVTLAFCALGFLLTLFSPSYAEAPRLYRADRVKEDGGALIVVGDKGGEDLRLAPEGLVVGKASPRPWPGLVEVKGDPESRYFRIDTELTPPLDEVDYQRVKDLLAARVGGRWESFRTKRWQAGWKRFGIGSALLIGLSWKAMDAGLGCGGLFVVALGLLLWESGLSALLRTSSLERIHKT